MAPPAPKMVPLLSFVHSSNKIFRTNTSSNLNDDVLLQTNSRPKVDKFFPERDGLVDSPLGGHARSLWSFPVKSLFHCSTHICNGKTHFFRAEKHGKCFRNRTKFAAETNNAPSRQIVPPRTFTTEHPHLVLQNPKSSAFFSTDESSSCQTKLSMRQ